MARLLLLLLLFISLEASSQRIKTKKAITACDSILKSKVGDKVYPYFTISDGSFYLYTNHRHGKRTGKFLSRKKLPRSFETLSFLYHFNYPEIEGVRSGVWLTLDHNLSSIGNPDFAFIPKFITENRPSDFIPADSALIIAKTNFTTKGIEVKSPTLSYNEKLKRYEYSVENIVTRTKDNTGRDVGSLEVIRVNAFTAKIESIEKGSYGYIIR